MAIRLKSTAAMAAGMAAALAAPAAALDAWNMQDAGVVATGFQYHDLDRDGDLAAAASPAGRITALDLSQPVASMILGHTTVQGVFDIDVLGDNVLYAENSGTEGIGTIGYAKGGAEPALGEKIAVPGSGVLRVVRWLGPNRVVALKDELHYFDFDGTTLTYGGTIAPFSEPAPIAFADSLLTVGTTLVFPREPLALQDLSDPLNVQVSGLLPRFPFANSFASILHMDAQYAVVTLDNAMHVVDVANPAYSHVAGQFPGTGVDGDRDDWRFAAMDNLRVTLYDISRVDRAAVVGFHEVQDFNNNPLAIVLRGNKLIVTGEPDGLRVYVSTGPQTPQFSGDKWSVK